MAENILHFGGVRYRVNGIGNLKTRFIGLDDSLDNPMLAIVMFNTPGKEPLRLGNFVSQRARLEMKTTDINELMKVNRLVVYTRPIYFDYPQE